jgi:glucose-6-phosphate isomerase
MAGRLKAIRSEIVADPRGIDLPSKLLEEYGSRRAESRLFQILAEARRLRDTIDRLVIVADVGIARATRLLVSACCHPFHDQLPRGERGGRPRLAWVDTDADTDRLHGILDLVAPEGRPRSHDLLDQWAMMAVTAVTAVMAVDPRRDERSTLATVQVLADALAKAADGDTEIVSQRIVAIARSGSALAEWADALGCHSQFHDGPASGGPEGVFTAAALLPAAIGGINVVRLLEGAHAMLVRFAEAPAEANPVLADAATRYHASREAGLAGSVFHGGGEALAELGAWMEHVRPARAEAPALVTEIVIMESRRGSLAPHREAFRPVTIRLPRLDEHALGQLLQLVILSAAVEERLCEAV